MAGSLLELIKQRRTIYDFFDQPIDKSLIEQCLSAAIWAPNHHLTQPWRFWVLGEQTQQAFAQIHAGLRASKKFEIGSVDYQQAFAKSEQKICAIPQIILVGQTLSNKPSLINEDYAACTSAIYAFQLAAWEQGLGMQWCSAPSVQSDLTYQMLNIEASKVRLIHALFCGYPNQIPTSTRHDWQSVTQFLS